MPQEFDNAASCWKTILSDAPKNRGLLHIIEGFARENSAPAVIVFGTSGWRGETGTDFTFSNLRIVVSAVVEMFRCGDNSVMKAMDCSDFEEIKQRGIIVGHDNRFLGREFAMEIIGMLQHQGIKTWYAGEATTPELSAAVEMIHAACSVNLTASHNPANYSGFKFNPADGGPAGAEITTKIEETANRIMQGSAIIRSVKPEGIKKIDTAAVYLKYITERKTLDIDLIRDFFRKEDCFICIDNVHGATRQRIEKIIGDSPKIKYLRTSDDFLFGGVAPEPSEKNMEGVEKALRESTAGFRLGAIMDPDGDRIRHADGQRQIPMNYFGAMALHFLHEYKGLRGCAVKSMGTSNFVNAIAGRLAVPVIETRVGFKNFRPYMLSTSLERAIVVFEESDGISAWNHTLEKDALFGLLLAIEMMARTRKNLSEYLKGLMDEFGYYYPDRSGISVDRCLAGEPLTKKLSIVSELYKKGSVISVGVTNRTVEDVVTLDGTKLVFDDGSWLMIRPSGTEPKVRFYIEARTEDGRKAVFEAAEKIALEALGMQYPAQQS